jgi:hypothetical protein
MWLLRTAGAAALVAVLGVTGCGGGTPISLSGTVSIPFDGPATYSAGTVTVPLGQIYSYVWSTNDCGPGWPRRLRKPLYPNHFLTWQAAAALQRH